MFTGSTDAVMTTAAWTRGGFMIHRNGFPGIRAMTFLAIRRGGTDMRR